ncbi:VOC family protein [Pigmentiphaga kullae]|uniref:Catechol 2,3-dioxygenase n=1 Tax=Pigmentiphaga kullae TaxID=151784 RepID=A0A4Q7NII6_9BURK|nr:VOC family protein [Pigmentiphaga kullae]RZS84713.1 catechol 2,3-dioxygenase [Pigmentiphaga kullae]
MNQGAIFQPRRLGHVNLVVADLQRSIDFYRDVCGLNLEFTESGLRAAFMGTGHTPHDVGMMERTSEARQGRDGHTQIARGAARAVNLNHIAWEMDTEAELVRAYERARAAGIAVPRTLDHQIAHSVYLKDPDGNTNEFYADTIKDWRAVLHGDVALITSTWKPGGEAPATDRRWNAEPDRRPVPGAVMQPLRLSHVVLTTTSLAPMAAFYTEVAGLETVARTQGGILLRASGHPTAYQLAIIQGEVAGMHHYGFDVAGGADLDAAAGRLRSLGCLVGAPAARRLTAVDPDGFLVAFAQGGAADLAMLEDALGTA